MSQDLRFSLIPPERYRAARALWCRVGAVCAVLYACLHGFQHYVLSQLPEDAPGAAGMALRAMPLDRARELGMLLTVPLLFLVFAATALDRVRRAPGAAMIGFAAGLLFTVYDSSYRAIDYFYFSIHVVHAFEAAQLDAVKEALIARVAEWDAVVIAIYFPMVLAGTTVNGCFAFALRGARGWVGRAGFAAFALNAARNALRILSFGGVHALEPFNDAIFFPGVLVHAVLLALWLWNTARIDPTIDMLERATQGAKILA